MSNSFKISNRTTVGSKKFQDKSELTGEDYKGFSKSVAAAKAGTLSTRTDNDTGILTVASGHGITTSDKLDIYWNDPTTGSLLIRRNMTVTAQTSTTISIDVGAGTQLPVATTALFFAKCVETEFVLTGNEDYQALVIACDADCSVVFLDDTDTAIISLLILATVPLEWHKGSVLTNPLMSFEGAKLRLSHKGTTAEDIDLHLLYN